MIDARATRRRARIAVGLCAAVIIALTALRHFPAAIAQKSSDLGAFDGHGAVEQLQRFVGDGRSRAVATAGHAAALERLRDRLAELGCEVTEQKFFARGWNRTAVEMTNVLARVRGKSANPQPPLVMLSAHYDCVPAGSGAGDNGAGVACALEIIRALSAVPPANDVLVLFPDGEETGLCGAKAFVLDSPAWAQVGAVVNLDARGSDGPVYIFETGARGGAHAAFLSALNVPARTTSLAAEAYRRMPNGTDFSVYMRVGRAGFNLAFIGSPRNYHTAGDTMDALDARTMNQMGTSALALVRALAEGQPPMPSRLEFAQWTATRGLEEVQPAVWFDVFGFFIAHWPTRMSNAFIIASVVLLLSALRDARRASVATLIGTIVAALGTLTGLIGAVLAGTLASLALARSGVDFPWPASSIWWGDGALLMIGAAAMILPSRLIARRRLKRRASDCVGRDAWFGGWFVLAMLAAFVAYFAPGAVHPLLVPLVIAAAVTISARARGWMSADWCAVATALAALAVWAPLEPTFADAFGLSLGGFTALRGACIAIAMQPLCDPAR